MLTINVLLTLSTYSHSRSIFCIPLNPTLDDMKYMGSFLTKFMKGKSIFVVVMTDGSTEQESAVVDLEKILKNYIGPDTQQNMRFYATPVHEIYHNLQLEDFLSANPDIPDGIELQTAIKDFLGDNLKSLEGLSPKVMSQRALIMKHTRERAECLTKVIRSLGDLIADSQQHAHRAAYEKLKTFHDSSSKKLNDWERAFKGSDTRGKCTHSFNTTQINLSMFNTVFNLHYKIKTICHF